MRSIREEASRLVLGIKCTSHLPYNYSSGRYLVFNFVVWSETREDSKGQGARITYAFFEKEVSAPTVSSLR